MTLNNRRLAGVTQINPVDLHKRLSNVASARSLRITIRSLETRICLFGLPSKANLHAIPEKRVPFGQIEARCGPIVLDCIPQRRTTQVTDLHCRTYNGPHPNIKPLMP